MNQEQQLTANVRHKRLLIEKAIQHVKEVFESVPDLVDFHPDFIRYLGMINPDDPGAPMMLKQVVSKATQLRLFLDLTSLPLMKIWDYYGDGLLVLKGDKCFAIVHDLQPMTDGETLKVHKIHKHMFLCIGGPQVQADRLIQYALTKNSEHWTNYGKHMCPEDLSLELSRICYDNLWNSRCTMIIAGFSDDKEASIYKVDAASYRQSHADFAVMGRRSSDISRMCVDLQANKLDHKKLYDRAKEAFGAALGGLYATYKFRAHAYIVTPDRTEEKRLEGTARPRGYYLLHW